MCSVGDGEISIKEFLAQCDDEYREDGALGEMDEESKARQASLSPKKDKAARKNVFGQTMNLTIAADQALYNRHTRAKGAQPFKLAAKREIVPVAEDAKAGIEKIMEFIKIEQLKLTDMFYKIDVDGSGDIEPMELVEALRKMGLALSPAELNAVVHELDVDGDGSVELHEYLTQMKRINRAPPDNFCRTCGCTCRRCLTVCHVLQGRGSRRKATRSPRGRPAGSWARTASRGCSRRPTAPR